MIDRVGSNHGELTVAVRPTLGLSTQGTIMIEAMTETNAVICVKGNENSEPWNVSHQQLYKY